MDKVERVIAEAVRSFQPIDDIWIKETSESLHIKEEALRERAESVMDQLVETQAERLVRTSRSV